MTRTRILAAALLLLSLQGVHAQNGNTLLSRFGPGELQLPLTARNRSMGWVSTASPSGQDISLSNPALWTGLEGMRLQGDLTYETEAYALDSKLSYGSAAFKGLQFSLPLEDQMRTRLVAGFLPVTRVGYDVTTTSTVDTERYTALYKGAGGISSFRIGFAMRPLSFLNIGVAYQYFFGSIDHRSEVSFSNGSFFPGNQTRSTSHNGMGAIMGLHLEPVDGLGIAFALQTGSTINASRNSVVEYASGDSIVTGASGTIAIPKRISAGLSYRFSSRLMVAADLTMQDWTGVKMFDAPQPQLGASTRYGAGIEWLTGPESKIRGAASPTVLRFGIAHQVSNVRLNGVDLKEFFVTAGAGLPIIGQNRADIALEYGWRGGDTDPLGARTLFRFSVSVSVGESWFVRRAAE